MDKPSYALQYVIDLHARWRYDKQQAKLEVLNNKQS